MKETETIEFKDRQGRIDKPCKYCGVNDFTYKETAYGFETIQLHRKTCKYFKEIINLRPPNPPL